MEELLVIFLHVQVDQIIIALRNDGCAPGWWTNEVRIMYQCSGFFEYIITNLWQSECIGWLIIKYRNVIARNGKYKKYKMINIINNYYMKIIILYIFLGCVSNLYVERYLKVLWHVLSYQKMTAHGPPPPPATWRAHRTHRQTVTPCACNRTFLVPLTFHCVATECHIAPSFVVFLKL
jgi:hypothetical protein